MRFAYADPPYYGCAVRFYGEEAREYDTIDAHARLIRRLVEEFPDGWALSMTSTSLWNLLRLCPSDVRIAAWVKPFASFKPGVNPAYAWEPVIFRGGRKRDNTERSARDWMAAPMALGKGLRGSKPIRLCEFVLELLNVRPADELIDLFPGTNTMRDARAQTRLDLEALWAVSR